MLLNAFLDLDSGMNSANKPRVAIVVPSYRVADRIAQVLNEVGNEVSLIYVVDDACPEDTGKFVEQNIKDDRIRVLRNQKNLGVGGAVIAGYHQALKDGADIVVKLDSDGQMDPAQIKNIIAPIAAGAADYTKGNRFFRLEDVRSMPTSRLIGNACLSFLAKISTGYWNLFDPNNGYTAIHSAVLRELPLHKISQRYFFESDMLFRLNTFRAVVMEVPMVAHYAGESSSMRPIAMVVPFALGHLRNTFKRVFYNYFLRGFSVASLELLLASLLLTFGATYGIVEWYRSWTSGQFASAGEVMLASLPVILGLQLLLAFLGYDMRTIPDRCIGERLLTLRETRSDG